MAGQEIAICTVIVSFGPYITDYYFLLTILSFLMIIACMEWLNSQGFFVTLHDRRIERHSKKRETSGKDVKRKDTRNISTVKRKIGENRKWKKT